MITREVLETLRLMLGKVAAKLLVSLILSAGQHSGVAGCVLSQSGAQVSVCVLASHPGPVPASHPAFPG